MKRSFNRTGAHLFDKQNLNYSAIVDANANTRHKFAKDQFCKFPRFNDVPGIATMLCALRQQMPRDGFQSIQFAIPARFTV